MLFALYVRTTRCDDNKITRQKRNNTKKDYSQVLHDTV